MGTVLSINLAVPERSTAKEVGVTGINKQPVPGPVMVRPPGPKTVGLHSGLVGDQIFDIAHHGGDFQAVYAYAREDLDWWEQQLGRTLPGGMFGENLTTTGLEVNGALIGERWRIGSDVLLQTTFGRIPCATFQARMGEPQWVKRFTEQARPGAYLQVIESGEISPGDPIEVTFRPSHNVTIAEGFLAWTLEPELAEHVLAAEEYLHPEAAQRLRRRLGE